jgi:hypothetical protein
MSKLPRILFVAVSVFGVALMGAGIYRSHGHVADINQAESVNQGGSEVAEAGGQTITDWNSNVQIKTAAGWRVIATSSIAIPEDLDDARFALQKDGTSCIFAYAKASAKLYETYQQSSFGDRVFAGTEQSDSSWFIRRDTAPSNFEFQWQGKQPFPHEMRIASSFEIGRGGAGQKSFVLYDKSGGVVSSDCNLDANSMIESAATVYQETSLTLQSEGALYLTHGKLIFLSGDDIPREVMPFPSEGSPTGAFAYGNMIYYTDKNGQIHEVDPFTKKDKALTYLLPSDIQDFVVLGHMAYALDTQVKQDCTVKCGVRLLAIDLRSGGFSVIYDNVYANKIIGVNEAHDILYFNQAWGDAGCVTASISKFNLGDNTIEELGNYGGCEGDPDLGQKREKLDAIYQKIDVQPKYVSHILLSTGVFHDPGDRVLADLSLGSSLYLMPLQ